MTWNGTFQTISLSLLNIEVVKALTIFLLSLEQETYFMGMVNMFIFCP
jgi:hypothetical protein